MSALYNISKLDDTNYDSWSLQVRSVLIHQDLWSVVSGQSVKPEPSATNAAEVAAWNTKDEKATATIILSATPIQIAHIKNCITSAETWNTLREVHRPKGPVRKVTLFKQLLQMRMSDDECVQQYICNFASVVEKLAETGITLQEELYVIMLLASLPKSYENLVVALEARDDLPKLSTLKIKLSEEGERRKVNNGATNADNSVQVFMARENKDKKRNSYNKNNNSNDSNKNHQTRKSNFKCFNCGRKGHYAAQCRDKNTKGERRDDQTQTHTFSMSNEKPLQQNIWCVDSGASAHLCCDRNMFDVFEEHTEEIILAGNNRIQAKGRGQVYIKAFDIILKDVLYIPCLQCNFVSVGKAVSGGCMVQFNNKEAIITSGGKKLFVAKKVGNLFLYGADNNELFFSCNVSEDVMKWHRRFGHMNFASLRQLVNKEMVLGLHMKVPDNIKCTVCLQSKCCVKPFQSSETRAKDLLEIVHSDVCGPMNTVSSGGAKYMLTFIDDKSRYIFVYFIQRKDEVLDKFKEFKSMVERQVGHKVKILRSDNGTEYVNGAFDSFLKENGIVRQLTVPYTPQQNGVAERFNRTLVEMARCMLVGEGLTENLWAEAVNTAAYLRNRAPTKALDEVTPYEVWFNRKPVVKHLRTFGSVAIALDKKQHSKFKPKGKEYIMVGYSDTSKAYRLYEKATRKVIVSRDVYFVEPDMKEYTNMELLPNENDNDNEGAHGNIVDAVEPSNQNESDYESAEEVPGEVPERRRPGRPKIFRTGASGRPKNIYNTINLMCSENVNVPESVDEALSSEHSLSWWDAMESEYNALICNKTWELVRLPEGQKTIGCRWVFALKRNKNGDIERFKARLVAKGCAQIYGVNYDETFSPVVRFETIRMVFALAAEYKLHLHQLDVSTACLNSELEDDVYITQPAKFVDEKRPHHVLKLKKALYGLRQSGRQWNRKLNSILNEIGFIACGSEPCLYIKRANNNVNIIAVYVDDMLLGCSNIDDLDIIKREISKRFEIVDKGPVNHFLNMEIERDGPTGSIAISQRANIKQLLKRYGLEDCRSVSTPLEPNFQVACNVEDCKRVSQLEYQSLIGSLMYIGICTRPDIIHSVSKLSQKNKDPHGEHFTAAKRVLKYLNKTIDLQLKYYRTGEAIKCYVDADWGGDAIDRKSYTGYTFILAGAAISWESRKQRSVALSSTEAEYMALSSAAKEATYISKLLNEIQLHNGDVIEIQGDNLGSLQLVKNPIYHARSKHIDIKYHHVRNLYESGLINLKYCNTKDMIADVLTKNLQKVNHEKFCNLLGLTL